MIELKRNHLHFSFPEIHPEAKFSLEFQRTLRIPDDGNDYPLPPGFGAFPVEHVDDHRGAVPNQWLERGGVMLPMFQSEALWINFRGNRVSNREASYPFAVRIGAGKINAITGGQWTSNKPQNRPQDYLVVPNQPWLDGYCVEKGYIRQFVAMPLGSGYSPEEQINEKAEHGGIQIQVYPMKKSRFEELFPIVERKKERSLFRKAKSSPAAVCCAAPDMGLAAGGRMKQEIYDDPFDIDDWDTTATNRCFVHLANSLIWRDITGKEAPSTPATAAAYNQAGLPWYDYYDGDATAVDGSATLAKVKSITQLAKEKADNPLPENESFDPDKIIALRKGLKKNEIRDGYF